MIFLVLLMICFAPLPPAKPKPEFIPKPGIYLFTWGVSDFKAGGWFNEDGTMIYGMRNSVYVGHWHYDVEKKQFHMWERGITSAPGTVLTHYVFDMKGRKGSNGVTTIEFHDWIFDHINK